MAGFREMLAKRQKEAGTLVCVGLDPLPEKLPKFYSGIPCLATAVERWMTDVAISTVPCASMFKPQSAHWEAIPGGVDALHGVVATLRSMFPDIPVFLDCKRGDIARTQQRYRDAHLGLQGFDGMNFSPYMGRDCMAALVDKKNPGKALVGLCYTSNPDAREIQDAELADGRRLWEFIADRTLAWARELGVVEDAGLVMAAAYEEPKGSGNVYSEHLMRCRQIVGNELWFLIPGIGTQGGFITETVRTAYCGPGTMAINSSSDIIFASSGDDFVEAAAKKAKELRNSINAALPA